LENLKLVEEDHPKPRPGELLVRIRASSLNFHDDMVVQGKIPCADGRIPMSDGAGEVIALGDDVDEFKVADTVVSTFWPYWLGGEMTPATKRDIPGDSVDGYAREYVCMPAHAFTKAPAGYTHVEAATITCAGVTARVIATSSSEEKLEKLKSLGADTVINYKTVPDWGQKAKDLTDGRGVDHVIEVGGPGTLTQSITACRTGGHIALIGVLTGFAGEVSIPSLFSNQIRISGISIGSRADQEDTIRAITANRLKPVIDRCFPLQEIVAAFKYFESQKHFGKVCLEL
jgi:NADPH:quinone reductase-like Zn-dependent oxidoreductase